VATARISRRRSSVSGTIAPSHSSPVQRDSTASVAPFISIRRSPVGVRMTTLIRLRSDSKGISKITGAAGSSAGTPPLSAATTSAPSVGSPTTRQPPSSPVGSTVALPHRAAMSSSRCRSGSAAVTAVPSAIRRNSPRGS
jgi:phosphoribosylcarboxyaminoimidazole (NCAIR) mutase